MKNTSITAMQRLSRDDTEHGVEYYRASDVDALQPVTVLLQQSKQNFERNFGPCWQSDWVYRDLGELLEDHVPDAGKMVKDITSKDSYASPEGENRLLRARNERLEAEVAKRPWVGLTDDDFRAMGLVSRPAALAAAIEAKLKERNS